jgi:hypothetical protein
MPSTPTTEFPFADEWLAESEDLSPSVGKGVYDSLGYAIRDRVKRAISCYRWEDWGLLSHKGVKAAVHTTVHYKHKRQVKGLIVYTNGVCDLASTVLQESRARLNKPSKFTAQRILSNSIVLERIRRKLDAMLQEEDEPDFLNKPNEFATNKFRAFIESAYTHHVGQSPVPAIAPDGDGGVVAEWKAGQSIVRLIVAPDDVGKTYIYRKGNQESAIDHSPSGLLLAQRLTSIFGD